MQIWQMWGRVCHLEEDKDEGLTEVSGMVRRSGQELASWVGHIMQGCVGLRKKLVFYSCLVQRLKQICIFWPDLSCCCVASRRT